MICKYFLHFCRLPFYFWLFLSTSLVAQMVKCLPTMQETRVQSLGLEDPLEKEMATHSSILVWKIPWTEKPGWLLSMGSQRVGHDWVTSLSIYHCLCCDQLFKRFVVVSAISTTLWTNKKWLHFAQVASVQFGSWHPTPLLLPGKSHGQRSLVGCSPC